MKRYNSIIGIDVSFNECVYSGYMMMRYNNNEPLYKQEFEFVQLLPNKERERRRKNGLRNQKQVAHFSADELLKLYQDHKSAYDRFADDLALREYDDFYDFLVLADAMQYLHGGIFS